MYFINRYTDKTAINNAVDEGTLLKPYLALNDNTGKIDWDSYSGGSKPYEEQYLTFDIISGGTINFAANSSAVTGTSIQYSINDSEWTTITSTTGVNSFNVSVGDKVRFKGNNPYYASASNKYNSFSGSTATFNLYGNIMSLSYGDNFIGQNTLISGKTFSGLFDSTKVSDAGNLILPATSLKGACYEFLFKNCSKLSQAPELPATTLAQDCYYGMFQGCSSLTVAPELPATTLGSIYVYYMMFKGCTSLVEAPILKATKLTEACYYQMFYGCSKLKYVKCLATDISATDCTYRWVYGVSSTGTFVKAPSMTGWTTGNNGIPTGWTVQDAS